MKKILLGVILASVLTWAGFTKSGNIVTDTITNLQWQDNEIGNIMQWAAAIDYCENLNLDGYSDWRLPNINELGSLVDDTRSFPSIDNAFENTENDYSYFSSTTSTEHPWTAWRVNFQRGLLSPYYKLLENPENGSNVRCVRGG